MQLPPTLDAVKNRKTQKFFILLDDNLDTRYKVVNPSGEILILPDILFDEDPTTLTAEQFSEHFTSIQLDSYIKHLEKVAAQDQAPPPRIQNVTPKKIIAEPRGEPRKKSSPPKKNMPSRRGVGASWSAPRLTFYRHKIEPLDLKQSFRVEVQGVGTFEITKEDFLNHFNDASMSPSYRAEGLYVYKEVPEKARKYLKT